MDTWHLLISPLLLSSLQQGSNSTPETFPNGFANLAIFVREIHTEQNREREKEKRRRLYLVISPESFSDRAGISVVWSSENIADLPFFSNRVGERRWWILWWNAPRATCSSAPIGPRTSRSATCSIVTLGTPTPHLFLDAFPFSYSIQNAPFSCGNPLFSPCSNFSHPPPPPFILLWFDR